MSTGTAVQRNGPAKPTQAPAKRSDFLAMLDQSRGELAKMLPNERTVERVMRITRTAWQTDAKIQECSPHSILASVMKSAELNLDPCGARKHCYLIPYARECTLQVSYMGMLELAHRSGCFKAIEARVVHQGDTFIHEYNPEPVFRHAPAGGWEDKDITHAYAYASLASGALVLEVMTRAEIEKVRRTAKSGNVWNQWWGEMAKKTVIKRLLKRQPSSVQLAEAIELDDRQYDDSITVSRGTGDTASARLANRLAPKSMPEPENVSQEPPAAPEDESQEDYRDDVSDTEGGRNG